MKYAFLAVALVVGSVAVALDGQPGIHDLSMANCQIGLSAVVCEVLILLPGCATSLSYSFI
jgi:hypothetical protein